MATSTNEGQPPPALSTPNPQPRKKTSPPGQAWSEHETSHLIAAYEEMWYSLKRGPLKSHQWDAVAASLAARCGYGSRTGTQCRHKMEKLRKKYRAEKQNLSGCSSYWVHFDQMERMESGPRPISVRPPTVARPIAKQEISDEESEEEEEEEEEEYEEEVEEEERDEEDRVQAAKKLASVVKRFGEGLYRIEKRRIEMMRKLEMDWMEMEAKREEMWVESGRYITESITRAFRSAKKMKSSPET